MTELCRTYGGALFELCEEEGKAEELRSQLRDAVSVLSAEPQYLKLLCTPSIPKAERCGLIDEAFSGADPYLLNFLKILCKRGALRELSGCEKEFSRRFNETRGIVTAVATSAVVLSAEEAEKLRQRLEAVTGKRVELTTRVDPSLLGGIRLEMEGKRYDGTALGRLTALRKELSGTVI